MNLKYYCPKCKSENIETLALNIQKPKLLSLDDAGKGSMKTIDALYRTTICKGTCQDCGYSREWSE